MSTQYNTASNPTTYQSVTVVTRKDKDIYGWRMICDTDATFRPVLRIMVSDNSWQGTG
jgi:hypothetical protein